jgi:hypothetical protein
MQKQEYLKRKRTKQKIWKKKEEIWKGFYYGKNQKT